MLHSPVPMLAPCPLVVTIHDLMFELFPEYALRPNRGRIASIDGPSSIARDAVVAISAATANDLDRLWGIDAPG